MDLGGVQYMSAVVDVQQLEPMISSYLMQHHTTRSRTQIEPSPLKPRHPKRHSMPFGTLTRAYAIDPHNSSPPPYR